MIRTRGIAMTFGIIGLASTTCGLRAQVPGPKAQGADLEWFQAEQEKSAALEKRLQEMFYRHVMCLPVDVSQLVTVTEAEAGVPRARAEEDLRRIRQDVQELTKEHEFLTLQLKSAQAKRTAARKTSPPVQHPGRNDGPDQPGQDRERARRPRSRGHRPASRPTEPVMLVEGSGDRGLVGRALFHAGKYESAIQELLPLTRHDDAEFSDLFHLALCYEKLAGQTAQQDMFAKANDLFSRIEARDSRESENGRLVLGEWGRAARTARQTMLWLANTGGWQPKHDIDSIRWAKAPSERGEVR